MSATALAIAFYHIYTLHRLLLIPKDTGDILLAYAQDRNPEANLDYLTVS